MKKLKLNVEELDVAEFQVETAAAEKKGTVYGNGPTYWYSGCVVCPNIHYTYSCGC